MKLLTIRRCEECKHHSYRWEHVCCARSVGGRVIASTSEIPKWCPLPDVPDDKEEK